MITLIAILLILAIVANVVLGMMVLLRTYQRPYGWYFAAALLGVVLWVLGTLVMLLGRHSNTVHIGAELFYIGPTLIPMAILLFSLAYPDNRRIPLWLPIGMGAVFIGWTLAFLSHMDLFARDIVITSGLNRTVAAEPGFIVYSLHFSVFFLATYYVLYRKYLRAAGIAKSQLSFTMVGAITASLLGMVTNLSLPIMGDAQFIWLGPILSLSFVGAVSYAIIKHQLFDIRLVVARALGYMLSLTAFATLYGLVVFGISRYLFHLQISLSAQVYIAAATGISALAFSRLKTFFDRFTNRLFFQDAYDSQALFADLNKLLVSSIDLTYLLRHTTTLLAENFKAEHCAIGLRADNGQGYRLIGTQQLRVSDSEVAVIRSATPHLPHSVAVTEMLEAPYDSLRKVLKSNNIEVLVRLAHQGHKQEQGLGYILLGPKKSGNSYNSRDVQVLDAVANELIIAIQNALHFEEIQNFNESLQSRIGVATHKLQQSNEKLKALDATKDEFISMASHQLRTPLTAVKGYLSMVLEGDAGKLNSNQRKLLEQSFLSSQRMVYLIADLLNLSRLNTGKFVIEAAPVNLADIVELEVNQLEETAKAREVSLQFEKPKKFPELLLDETKIHQVVMNFIDNAIYYTPAGGKIEVELRETPTAVEYLVKDNGIGVPRSEQHHLFNKFYRANNAKRARPDGTGLGLFMAKKVIAAQGGAIIFESQEGKGSTFGFRFNKAAVAVEQKPAAPLEALARV